jgi:hypothetical protein
MSWSKQQFQQHASKFNLTWVRSGDRNPKSCHKWLCAEHGSFSSTPSKLHPCPHCKLLQQSKTTPVNVNLATKQLNKKQYNILPKAPKISERPDNLFPTD